MNEITPYDKCTIEVCEFINTNDNQMYPPSIMPMQPEAFASRDSKSFMLYFPTKNRVQGFPCMEFCAFFAWY